MGNPACWPEELLGVFEQSVTAEFATLSRAVSPVTSPVTPYMGVRGDTLDVSTGLAYPAKAERARRDPRVSLLFADPIGARSTAPVVLVQGLATVRDGDLQANTDRYVRSSMEKIPAATKGQPRAALRRMAWYYARIWVEVTPLHILWWPDRSLSAPPSRWHAPEGTAAPLSDPAPPGMQPRPWIGAASDWRKVAERAVRLALHDLTVVDANGFPMCLPLSSTELTGDGLVLELGPGAPPMSPGPACVTMHGHAAQFTGQENHTLVGSLTVQPGALRLRVDRALGDWSLSGNRAQTALRFLSKGKVLRRRLVAEAARRDQSVPRVRFGTDR